MRSAIATLIALAAWGWPEGGMAELIQLRLGGKAGADWEESTFLNVMMETDVAEGAIQPLELKPDVDIVAQLDNWTRYRSPIDLDYVVGKPRVWRAIGELSWPGYSANPLILVDGDLESQYSIKDFASASPGGAWGEFFTLDFSVPIPAERFVVLPADGVDPFTQEPYRPNFAFNKYELTASNDVAMVNRQTSQATDPRRARGPSYYRPLDILLKNIGQNFEAVIDIEFPVQYVQFLRIMFFPDAGDIFAKFSLADFEVYGRGFVPRTRWVSKVLDMGQIVNIGRVHFGLSKWRREGEDLVPAPQAPARVEIDIKTGLDDTPIAYQTYNDLHEQVEVTRTEYNKLKPRVFSYDPPSVGWRGPVIDDQNQWSFWSPPLRESGQWPRVPRGRYLQLRIQLQTEELWEFARIDSLVVEASPLLADRVVGEVAAVGDLQPESKLVEVEAGESTEFLYEIGAEFTGAGQGGFDAVRFLTPSAGTFLELEMGEPLAVVAPDSVVAEEGGFTVFLPQQVRRGEAQRLRVRLATTVFGASGQMQSEVFARAGDSLPQSVEAGDVSEEIGTDQLRVVAHSSSLTSVLGQIEMLPATVTPQGDGINDQIHINYTLFRVLQEIEVEIEIYTLGGDRVRQLRVGDLSAGRHSTAWDGRDDAGQVVAPGLYLVRLGVETDQGTTVRLQPIAVAY